ncbi:hypothetical protein [Cohnella silvisoli]|uniref:Uncharacterized protein n=1 Tax=Cohnella silvisoli TaxID=2873699 RepID=A0ABV1KY33_9BACL|nr:hypothetical protein [Cohnella silvisoli]MCD9021836.1 hypothetical protein [Cohnella silvisoli]
MYGNYSKSKFISVVLIIIGALMFFIDLVRSFSFSLLGVILVLLGISLISTIKTTAEEFSVLRQELIEIRKIAKENSKDRS